MVQDTFGLKKMVMVGDRGMITTARIEALTRPRRDAAADTYAWITALRAPAIRKLMADDGPLQLSLFDEQDLAEITTDDFPGERLIACRNPALAEERARKREDLLAATEKLLAPLIARVGRPPGRRRRDRQGRQGDQQVQDGQALRHHHHRRQPDRRADQDQIDAEARLDGIYVIRTPVPAEDLDAAGIVTAYKALKNVERDFRHIKSDDLDLRPSSTASKTASRATC